MLTLLARTVGEVPDALQEEIATLSWEKLEELASALLGFQDLADLINWLRS